MNEYRPRRSSGQYRTSAALSAVLFLFCVGVYSQTSWLFVAVLGCIYLLNGTASVIMAGIAKTYEDAHAQNTEDSGRLS